MGINNYCCLGFVQSLGNIWKPIWPFANGPFTCQTWDSTVLLAVNPMITFSTAYNIYMGIIPGDWMVLTPSPDIKLKNNF